MDLQATIDERLCGITDLRHRLHQIPELNYEEFKTAAMIREQLDRAGVKHVDGVVDAPTATIAWSATRNPCIALRADIDALPIVEQTGLPYASTHAAACTRAGTTVTRPRSSASRTCSSRSSTT